MSKQFFYTREIETEVPSEIIGAPAKTEVTTLVDSLNMDRVLRTVEHETGALIVVLDDGHEKTVQVPTGKKNEFRNERRYGCTEVYLFGEDVTNFRVAAGYAITPIAQTSEQALYAI